MFYTIYKITNQINGKFYIGSHKTVDLNDNYMGSGKYLARSIEKHGIENFTKEILFIFDNPEEMYAKEAEIVNEDFLAEENTYNLKLGGFGGWDHVNKSGLNGCRKGAIRGNERQKWLAENDPNWKGAENKAKASSENMKRLHAQGKIRYDTFTGKKHTDESKKKISESHAGKIPWNLGLACSEEVKQKISESLKGRPSTRKGISPSEETKQKISNTLSGRKLSEETKQKISIAQKSLDIDRTMPDSAKKKISVANKGRSWYNNGVESRMFKPDEILDGFTKGRL